MGQPPKPSSPPRDEAARPQELHGWMVRYGPALRRYFNKRVGAAEAEDLVQDVFVAMQVRGAIDDPDKVDRYLFRVAAHILARRRARPGWNWAARAELDEMDAPPDELSPERILIANERLARLMTALGALPPRMAEAFVLHRFDEMTYAEIARRMGVSVRTVESFIARAVTRVALMVEGRAMNEAAFEAAGVWFARSRSGAMTPQQAAELEAWRADPVNRAAFEAVERGWAGAEEFRRAPEILALRERARGRRAGVTRAVLGRAAAACLALAVIGAGGYGLKASGLIDLRRFSSQAYATRVGERTAVTLPDGSVVTLNTDTRVRTAPDRERRIVYLDRGQAFFRVAKDAEHPFVVHAAGRTITALGTAFDVRVDQGRLAVTLLEGKVRVEAPAPTPVGVKASPAPAVRRTEMLPGDQFVAVSEAKWTLARTDAVRETSWLAGRLKFEGKPLGEIAAEFDRYSDRKIVIDDAALAARPVSGSFRADDQDAFIQALEIAGLARVDSRTDAAVRLGQP